MVRINVFLLALLIVCALSLVTSRHQARKLFVELESNRQQAQMYKTDNDRLMVELSTWSIPGRVDRLARNSLAMQLPEPDRIQVIEVPSDWVFLRERGREANRVSPNLAAMLFPQECGHEAMR